jgi:ATP-binding cassette, subfamily C, bacterial LapB
MEVLAFMTTRVKLQPPMAWCRPDVLVSSVTINILTLALPFVILQIYDRILPNVAYSTLSFLVGALIAITVVDVILKICRAALLSATGARFEHKVGVDAFNKILKADLKSYEKEPAAHYVEGFKSLSRVRDFHSGQTAELMADLPFAFLFIGLIWLIAGSLVLVPIIVLGLFATMTWYFSRNLKAAMEDRTLTDERRVNFQIETLEGIHTIKSMAMENSMVRRYERLEAQSALAVRDLTLVHGKSLSAGYFFSQLAVGATVVIGSTYVVGNSLTMGGLAACTMLTGRSLRPVLRGMSFWNNRQGEQIARSRAEELFNIETEKTVDRPTHDPIQGAITLDNVSLEFDPDAAPVLDRISLHIKPGEALGIVGGTGCGKTSLLRLINGTTLPTEGRVLVDERALGHYVPSQLRRQVGFMPDTGALFEGSILDNVAMFRDGEPKERAVEVMRFLGLDDYISQIPDGLETKLSGTRADRVPGGIKQRLVLARALVDAPRVLLFDNANNGLDTTSDEKLLAALREMRGSRTMIIACQRPSYLKICDRVLELKDGKLLPYVIPTYPPRQANRAAEKPANNQAQSPNSKEAKA